MVRHVFSKVTRFVPAALVLVSWLAFVCWCAGYRPHCENCAAVACQGPALSIREDKDSRVMIHRTPNKITRANAGGPRQLPRRTR